LVKKGVRMKKKITLGVLIGLLVITGCSKQPSLKDAKEVQTTSSQFVGNENSRTNESGNGVILDEGGIVSTENANVEEETISSTVVSTTSNNQEFAKKLSSIIVYFDFDKYNIRADQWPKVEQLAELIKSNPSNYTVRIEGNCDEWGTEEYNYALGLKRANSVKNALIKLGVDPKKLTVISYGELNPVCTAHARWCWRKNRRDNFTYLP